MVPEGINAIFNQIRAKILMSGPISVADYMKLALFQSQQALNDNKLNQEDNKKQSSLGYYMGKDVFGREGDFITSPEVNQMFGEMIGVWGLQTWTRIGGPKKFSIVEMGPGRGTMAKDILRVFRRFLPEPAEISLHLIEISPYLAKKQFQILCRDPAFITSSEIPTLDPTTCLENKPFYYHAETFDTKIPVYWYSSLLSLPHDFHFYVGQEFLDVLPIHKLQKVENSWREVLVDLQQSDRDGKCKEDAKEILRYVISRNETPVIKVIQNLYPSLLNGSRTHLEISLGAIEIYEAICKRLNSHGGIALFIDYGHEGKKEDTFRGFHKHKVVDPLKLPGQIDLTSDVDFSSMYKVCQDKVLFMGPITQRAFLQRIGIATRARTLFDTCENPEEKSQLLSSYKMLLTELGDKFFCIAMLPKIIEEFRPKLKILAFDN